MKIDFEDKELPTLHLDEEEYIVFQNKKKDDWVIEIHKEKGKYFICVNDTYKPQYKIDHADMDEWLIDEVKQ